MLKKNILELTQLYKNKQKNKIFTLYSLDIHTHTHRHTHINANCNHSRIPLRKGKMENRKKSHSKNKQTLTNAEANQVKSRKEMNKINITKKKTTEKNAHTMRC